MRASAGATRAGGAGADVVAGARRRRSSLASAGACSLAASVYRMVPLALNAASWRLAHRARRAAGHADDAAAALDRRSGERALAGRPDRRRLRPRPAAGRGRRPRRRRRRGRWSPISGSARSPRWCSPSWARSRSPVRGSRALARGIVIGCVALDRRGAGALSCGGARRRRRGCCAALPLHLRRRSRAARPRAGAVDRALAGIGARPRRCWHRLALAPRRHGWRRSVETWLVLRLLARSSGRRRWRSRAWPRRRAAPAFVVPGGIGVQEGALVPLAAAVRRRRADRAGAGDHQARARAAGRRAGDRRLGRSPSATRSLASGGARPMKDRRRDPSARDARWPAAIAGPGSARRSPAARRRAGRPALEPDGGRSRQDLGAAGAAAAVGARKRDRMI